MFADILWTELVKADFAKRWSTSLKQCSNNSNDKKKSNKHTTATNIQNSNNNRNQEKKSPNNKCIKKILGIFLTYKKMSWDRKGKQIETSQKKKRLNIYRKIVLGLFQFIRLQKHIPSFLIMETLIIFLYNKWCVYICIESLTPIHNN